MKCVINRLALFGLALTSLAVSAETARGQTEDNRPPVINELSISHSEVNLTDGPVELIIRYDIEDTTECPENSSDFLSCGTTQTPPSGINVFEFDLHDETRRRVTGFTAKLDGEIRLQGEYRIMLPAQLPAGEYQIWGRIQDKAGNWFGPDNITFNLLPSTPESFTIINSNEDIEAPQFNAISFTPNTIGLSTSTDRTVTIDYEVEDTGGAGLGYVLFTFRDVSERYPRSHLLTARGFDPDDNQTGQIEVKVPETMPEGVYRLEAWLYDAVRNGPLTSVHVAEGQTLTLTDFILDTDDPILVSASVSRDSIDLSESNRSITISYEVEDVGAAGLSTLSFRLAGTNGGFPESVENGEVYYSGFHELNGAATYSGEYTITLPRTAPTDTYRLTYTLKDEQNNLVSGDFPFTPNEIEVTDSHTRAFGPFIWSDATGNQTRDVFRISGLDHGMPTQIRVALAYIEEKVYGENIFSDCQLEVNPARYSGSEYLIVLSDIVSGCGDFGRSDLSLQIQAHPNDLDQLQIRRFKVSPSGMLSDFGVDRDTQSGLGELVDSRLQFGPFEWVEVSGLRTSQFRLSGLRFTSASYLDVAISNASKPGFNGDFDDCRLTGSASATRAPSALITAESILEACGDFGRADLTFRYGWGVQADEPASMTRLVVNPSGAVTDLSIDHADVPARQPQFRDFGINQVDFGPFEWSGDANAPTQSLFRLTGVSGGAPSRIQVALGNANSSGYTDAFNDCELSIQADQTGEKDYLITSADLAACGAFGRADLRFRIIASDTDMPLTSEMRLRRLSIGAFGDLTDFGFDLDSRDAIAPTPIGNDLSEIIFGPFEWTGDSTASTQSVFRISGIAGAPASIDVAIDNATEQGFTGDFEDCSLNLRGNRAGLHEYVIASNDLVDCGRFTRADIRFRIRALADQFANEVRMRRFAITTNGGLTDFGFDNQ
jgi:hypothetical protein